MVDDPIDPPADVGSPFSRTAGRTLGERGDMNQVLLSILVSGGVWLAGQIGPDAKNAAEKVNALPGAITAKVTESKEAKGSLTTPRETPAAVSDAERIARLQRAIETDEKELELLKNQFEDPESEYAKAQAAFEELDARRRDLTRQLTELKGKQTPDEQEASVKEAASLETQWKLAKDRFNLAIEQRKTLQEKATALRQKIEQDRKVLSSTMGMDVPPVVPAVPAENASTVKAAADPAVPMAPAAAVAPAPEAAVVSAANPAATTTSTSAKPAEVVAAVKPPSQEVIKARQEAEAIDAAAKAAKAKVDTYAERSASVQKNLALEEELLSMANKKSDQASRALEALNDEMDRALQENNGQADFIRIRIMDEEQRLADARDELKATQTRVDNLRDELRAAEGDGKVAQREANAKRREADGAQLRVTRLENPFSPQNLLRWLIDHAPRLMMIVCGMFFLRYAVTLSSRRLARVIARGSMRGTDTESEDRVHTLLSVFRSATSVAIYAAGTIMVLDEVGIPIVPLMGGAAVLGLAVAFGAQNLIRDYFCGFMVLVEDQYGINDVVRISGIAGQVERITLRMTALRDIEGVVHFIPHGTITAVSNLTHGWSRAFLEIGVSYNEDPDRVMESLTAIGREMRRDPVWAPFILDDPTMLGVDRLDDSSVVIAFFMKTRPLQQWPVKRELLRRIKKTFDQQGIEIPFPHRTVYHRYEKEFDTSVVADIIAPPSAA